MTGSLPERAQASGDTAPSGASEERGQLGVFLCWAVVFADIGTSVYYTPGILYRQVGTHAALFVGMTMVVFVLLTLKYAEVPVRYPEGGGVVTVATHAIHPYAGLLGGLFILVDYFLTAAISALSGFIYLSVVVSPIKSVVLPATVAALCILALLNVIGISASAKVTATIASIAFLSQLAVIVAVVSYLGPAQAFGAIHRVFSGGHLTPLTILTGYAGAFLAFSGLESIAQLAPAMKEPRHRTSYHAMGAVVATIGLTSPLLTLWSTTLLDAKRSDPNQFVSLLAGLTAGQWLEIEVAVTGAILLIFASNTAIIGGYHVFLSLSRMGFLPHVIQRTNRWRHTPHWAITITVGMPLAVVVLTAGNVGLLGDLYAFGLLGAFSMTCISLDIVRWHERRAFTESLQRIPTQTTNRREAGQHPPTLLTLIVGILTTILVTAAWVINLFAKPMATVFGTGVTVAGLLIAFATVKMREDRGHMSVAPLQHRPGTQPLFLSRARRVRPAAVLALIPRAPEAIAPIVQAAAAAASGGPIVFLHHGTGTARATSPRLFEVVDPYLDDREAQARFGSVEQLARERHLDRLYLYLPTTAEASTVAELYRSLRPRVILAVSDDASVLREIHGAHVSLSVEDSIAILHAEATT